MLNTNGSARGASVATPVVCLLSMLSPEVDVNAGQRAGPPGALREEPRSLAALLPRSARLERDHGAGQGAWLSGFRVLIRANASRAAADRVGEDAAPIPRTRRVGLYHFGLKIGETDDELREARDQLVAAGARLAGTADHGVTHSLYIEDPDGNEIELYIDVQPAVWKDDPAAVFAQPRPLRL